MYLGQGFDLSRSRAMAYNYGRLHRENAGLA